MNILVVAAHPDDEVLGCSATMASLSRTHQVHIGILGEGVSSRHARRADADRTALRRLQAQATTVGKLIGARSVSFGELPDNRFDEVPLLEIVKRVEAWIAGRKPQAIYTHAGGDLNLDHQLTFHLI